jgi:hypothetical protein
MHVVVTQIYELKKYWFWKLLGTKKKAVELGRLSIPASALISSPDCDVLQKADVLGCFLKAVHEPELPNCCHPLMADLSA